MNLDGGTTLHSLNDPQEVRLDVETLLERLRGIEWDDLELKEARTDVPKSAYSTVSAFANTSGGWLIFGVSESSDGSHHITGVEDADRIQNDFLGSCRDLNKFNHPIEVGTRWWTIDECVVLGFYIHASSRFQKPIRVRLNKTWQSFVRLGARDQQCSEREEARFLRDANLTTFDQQTLPDFGLDDLDERSIAWLRGLLERRDPAHRTVGLSDVEFLNYFGLLRHDKLTRAALLLLGDTPTIYRIKPNPILDYRVILTPLDEDAAPHRWDERVVFEENLVQTYQQVILKLHTLYASGFELNAITLQRQAISSYMEVLREALVNLLTHQDYGDQGRSARLMMYTNALTFDNPGDSLLGDAELAMSGLSDTRNPLIARMFRLCGLAEQAGSGLAAMQRAWKALVSVSPRIENDRAHKRYMLTFTLPESGQTPQVTPHVTPQVTPQVDNEGGLGVDIPDYIVDFISYFNGQMTREALQTAMGLKDRKHFQERFIRPALELELIAMTRPDAPRSALQRYVLTPMAHRLLEEE